MWQSIESIASRCTKSPDAGSIWNVCSKRVCAFVGHHSPAYQAPDTMRLGGGSRCSFRVAGEDPLFDDHSNRVWDSSSLVVSSNLRILHPIRLVHPHSLAPINTISHFPIFFSHRGSRLLNPVVLSKDLHAPNMRIFSVLMVLQHA